MTHPALPPPACPAGRQSALIAAPQHPHSPPPQHPAPHLVHPGDVGAQHILLLTLDKVDRDAPGQGKEGGRGARGAGPGSCRVAGGGARRQRHGSGRYSRCKHVPLPLMNTPASCRLRASRPGVGSSTTRGAGASASASARHGAAARGPRAGGAVGPPCGRTSRCGPGSCISVRVHGKQGCALAPHAMLVDR